MKFTFSVRSRPRARHARHVGLAAEHAERAHLARHAGHLLGEQAQRVGHRVDRLRQRGDLALGLDRHLLRQVALRHRRRHRGDLAHLVGQVRRHQVHRVGQVAPRARGARAPRPGRPAGPRCRPRAPRRSPARRTARSVSVIELIVSASAATSPLASTVTFCDRSPSATALVTDAIWRTWSVRLDAMTFTESVRSRHVPETSVDLRLAAQLALGAHLARDARHLVGERRQPVDHRVDRALERERPRPWPRPSPAGVRSPSATAVVTAAIWRTWSVRFDAMTFTESVRSRHVPDTPLTRAWPPSLPSVPTSRATRVASSAKDDELVDHRVHGRADAVELAA